MRAVRIAENLRMTVKWQYRDSRDGEWCRHYRGEYVVECQDMDGDGTEWNVYRRKDYDTIAGINQRNRQEADVLKLERYPNPVASGRVDRGNDFQIARVVAIAALEAIIKDAEESERERREHDRIWNEAQAKRRGEQR